MKQPSWILSTLLAASLLFNAVLLFRHGNERPAKADTLPAPSRSEPEGGAEWPSQPSKARPAPQEVMLDSGIQQELTALRERVAQLQVDLEEAREHAQRTDSLPPDLVTRLGTPIEADLRERTLFEVLELLRGQCGLHFIYDPVLQPKLETLRITMDMDKASARKVLHMIDEVVPELSIQYLNQFVWVRSQGKPK